MIWYKNADLDKSVGYLKNIWTVGPSQVKSHDFFHSENKVSKKIHCSNCLKCAHPAPQPLFWLVLLFHFRLWFKYQLLFSKLNWILKAYILFQTLTQLEILNLHLFALCGWDLKNQISFLLLYLALPNI